MPNDDEALRNELQDTNLAVTALQPGPTETNFFHRADMEDTKLATQQKMDPADVARHIAVRHLFEEAKAQGSSPQRRQRAP